MFDAPEIQIDMFAIEESRYRKKLEETIGTSKSSLTIASNNDTSKVPVLFSGKTSGVLIMNEFFDLRKKYSKNNRIEITLSDDNIYQWNSHSKTKIK
jgi:hypothetical protein